jgi:hypothetical protein
MRRRVAANHTDEERFVVVEQVPRVVGEGGRADGGEVKKSMHLK